MLKLYFVSFTVELIVEKYYIVPFEWLKKIEKNEKIEADRT